MFKLVAIEGVAEGVEATIVLLADWPSDSDTRIWLAKWVRIAKRGPSWRMSNWPQAVPKISYCVLEDVQSDLS